VGQITTLRTSDFTDVFPERTFRKTIFPNYLHGNRCSPTIIQPTQSCRNWAASNRQLSSYDAAQTENFGQGILSPVGSSGPGGITPLGFIGANAAR
jgi:hypothetical protein